MLNHWRNLAVTLRSLEIVPVFNHKRRKKWKGRPKYRQGAHPKKGHRHVLAAAQGVPQPRPRACRATVNAITSSHQRQTRASRPKARRS